MPITDMLANLNESLYTFNIEIVAELIQTIDQLIAAGRHRLAFKEIKKLKSHGLNPFIRVKVSEWYGKLGRPLESLKILGPEIEDSKLIYGPPENFALQSRLASMLSFFDANETARRIFEKLDRLHPARGDLSPDFYATFYKYKATFYLRTYEYKEALEAHVQWLSQISEKEQPNLYPFIKLQWADSMDGCGFHDKAIITATEVLDKCHEDQILLKGISHQARGEYYFRKGQFKKARSDFDEAWKFFPKEVRSADHAFLAKWSGALHLIEGQKIQAKRELKLAYKILNTNRLRPVTLLEVIYWETRLNPKLIEKESHRVLNTHPCRSPYGLLTGRECTPEDHFDVWISEQLPIPTANDCWLIENKKTQAAQYKKLVLAESKTLDLVAGVKIGAKKNFTALSPLKSKCMILLLASGHLGINDRSLVEGMYPGDWQNPENLLLRLNDLVLKLRTEGYVINRRKNQFYMEVPKDMRVILPMDFEYKGVEQHWLQITKEFSRGDLEKAYGIKPPTAKLWIKEWLDHGLIRASGQGRAVRYHSV